MYTRIIAMAGALLLAVPAVASAQAEGMVEGARVYSSNCTRCHNVRPPAERSDIQWRIIVNHMRARANLTRTQAQSVMTYLQIVNDPTQAMPTQAAAQPETAEGEGTGSAKKEGGEAEAGSGGGGGPPPGGGR